MHARTHGTTATLLTTKGGLSLSQCQTILGIFEDDERVALVDILELMEANLLDEALYTGVDGRHVAVDHGVVGIFLAAEMDETAANISQPKDEQSNDNDIVSS